MIADVPITEGDETVYFDGAEILPDGCGIISVENDAITIHTAGIGEISYGLSHSCGCSNRATVALLINDEVVEETHRRLDDSQPCENVGHVYFTSEGDVLKIRLTNSDFLRNAKLHISVKAYSINR